MTLHLHSPEPRRPLKRKLINLYEATISDTENKRSRHQQPIIDWLTEIPPLNHSSSARNRTASAPPTFNSKKLRSMSQQPAAYPGDIPARTPTPAQPASVYSVSTRVKTDDPNYPMALYNNGVILDRSGRKIPADIKTFIGKHIIDKPRSSPPLEPKDLDDVITIADLVADSCEDAVHRILETVMFPITRAGISTGGNVPFSAEAIPRSSDTFYELAIPKPGRFLGYTTGQNGDFNRLQNNVMSHPFMKNYAQPTSDSAFPFLVIEVKSEAKGGTLWHAENQAAGSGSHCVTSMKWLLENAAAQHSGHDPAGEIDPTKTLAFSICLTARQVILYAHSYSSEQQEFLMSQISSYLPSREKDIQACRNHVKNILDFALDVRRKDISESLDGLYPFPMHWPQKKSRHQGRSIGCSTPATSFTTPDSRR